MRESNLMQRKEDTTNFLHEQLLLTLPEEILKKIIDYLFIEAYWISSQDVKESLTVTCKKFNTLFQQDREKILLGKLIHFIKNDDIANVKILLKLKPELLFTSFHNQSPYELTVSFENIKMLQMMTSYLESIQDGFIKAIACIETHLTYIKKQPYDFTDLALAVTESKFADDENLAIKQFREYLSTGLKENNKYLNVLDIANAFYTYTNYYNRWGYLKRHFFFKNVIGRLYQLLSPYFKPAFSTSLYHHAQYKKCYFYYPLPLDYAPRRKRIRNQYTDVSVAQFLVKTSPCLLDSFYSRNTPLDQELFDLIPSQNSNEIECFIRFRTRYVGAEPTSIKLAEGGHELGMQLYKHNKKALKELLLILQLRNQYQTFKETIGFHRKYC